MLNASNHASNESPLPANDHLRRRFISRRLLTIILALHGVAAAVTVVVVFAYPSTPRLKPGQHLQFFQRFYQVALA